MPQGNKNGIPLPKTTYIPIPSNIDQAKGMILVDMEWLREYSPNEFNKFTIPEEIQLLPRRWRHISKHAHNIDLTLAAEDLEGIISDD